MRIRTLIAAAFTSLCLSGQTVPGLGSRNSKPLPPVVEVRTEVQPESLEAARKRLMANIHKLVVEAQALEQELAAAPSGSLPAASFKRSQEIEGLAKKIRKGLKQN
jgi:hypothetical protein